MTERRTLLAATAAAATLGQRRARAQTATVKIGVLNDMSGPFRDTGGPGSVECARQAAKEMAGHGFAIEVVAHMKATPTDDDAFGHGSIREDGRGLFPSYLFQVKTPAESHGPWDYYKLVATTPAAEAYRPLAEGGCALVHS